ncbi:hypothetical protein [Limnohabitans sp. Rim28]|jgi:hypothetical protein|nr:hypothetical protein [Limnohabitans sp. Rim28]
MLHIASVLWFGGGVGGFFKRDAIGVFTIHFRFLQCGIFVSAACFNAF